MPGLNRRFTLAATALPLLFLAMSRLSRAATITVTTRADPTGARGTCSLRQAITNANGQNHSGSTNCTAGSGNNDRIIFASGLTGTITLGSTLPSITDTNLAIIGPTGSPGITISGGGTVQLIVVPAGPEATLGSATLTLQLLTLTNGSAGEGGAIANGGTLIVSNCTFSNNVAGAGGGGAIYNGLSYNGVGVLTVSDSTFSQNQAGGDGGGAIFTQSLYPVTVTNCTFWDNTAGSAAAVLNGGGQMTVTDCTFVDNQAPAVNAFSGAVCSVFNPISTEGSILAGNTGTNCDCYGAGLANGGYNISDDDTCHLGHSTGANGLTLGDNVIPLLAAGPANNGGPTETIALVTSPPITFIPNPAIAAVPLAQCTVRTDQRGYSRPGSGSTACSIGAYEFHGVAPVTITGAFPGNMVITSGQSYLIEGGEVLGDIFQFGGSLVVNGNATIEGGVLIVGGTFSIDEATIDGPLEILQLPAGSPPDQICGTTVKGDVLLEDNGTAVAIGDPAMGCPGNTIGGSLLALDNQTVQVFDDTMGASLLCLSNSTITGGTDTAASLVGQCAGF